MPTTISPCAPMGLRNQERVLRDALRRSRRHTTAPERNPRVKQKALDLFSRGDEARSRTIDTIIAIAYDAFQRGAPAADVKEFGVVFCAIVDSWYKGDGEEVCTLAELHAAEEAAQGDKERAEIALAHDRSPANIAWFLDAAAVYDEANTRLVQHVRRLSVGAVDHGRRIA